MVIQWSIPPRVLFRNYWIPWLLLSVRSTSSLSVLLHTTLLWTLHTQVLLFSSFSQASFHSIQSIPVSLPVFHLLLLAHLGFACVRLEIVTLTTVNNVKVHTRKTKALIPQFQRSISRPYKVIPIQHHVGKERKRAKWEETHLGGDQFDRYVPKSGLSHIQTQLKNVLTSKKNIY